MNIQNDSNLRETRIILHVDMDHFFSAVEERENSSLKGKPVVVGADPKEGTGRGVVSTCNYQARYYGIHSGMPISKAWKLCPTALYLPPNFTLYTHISKEIMNILRKQAVIFQQWGIDEAFLDVSNKVNEYKEAKILALNIKNEIFWNVNLTCSIGIGPNKLIAKIASDYKKPNGLTIVKPDETRQFLSPLPVHKLLYVGKKTEEKLNTLGINTIGDLANFDSSLLEDRFGIAGKNMYRMAHGIDDSKVQERHRVESISNNKTFEEDTSDINLILDTLDSLSSRVYNRLVKNSLKFKTVTVRLRYENFETHTYSKTLTFKTGSLLELTKTTQKLLRNNLHHDRKMRLVGVKVSNLSATKRQETLIKNWRGSYGK
jgi:DNA polymerase IV (DinB-like DNA polymerase)